MTDAPHIAEPSPDSASQARVERQLAFLDRLAEFGLEIAEALAAEAKTPGADLEGVARGYARVSRAVRLGVLIQSKLIKDLESGEAPARQTGEEAAEEAAELEAETDPLHIKKCRVERIVERIARQTNGEDEDEIDRLVTEAGDRLDDEDIYGEVLTRPVGELVSLICRDLGLEPDWGRLAEEAWAREEADDPRSPFHATSPASGVRAIAESNCRTGPPAEERVVERAQGWQSLTSEPIPDWFARSPSG